MKKMQINIAKAIEGDEKIQDAFSKLGLNAGELMKAGPVEATKQIADALQGVNSQGEKLKLTMEIFGKSGTELVSTLEQGSEAIQEAIDFQQKWNGLSDEQTTAVGMNNDAWDRVSIIVEGISTKLAAEFAPAMNVIADYILDSSDGFTDIDGAITMVVDNTVMFVGFLKDAYELATVTHRMLEDIVTLDFSGLVDGVSEALTFDGAGNALDALNKKREEIELASASKAEEREKKKQAMLLENVEQVDKKKNKLEEEARKQAEEADRKRVESIHSALKTASKHFDDEAAKSKKMRELCLYYLTESENCTSHLAPAFHSTMTQSIHLAYVRYRLQSSLPLTRPR